MAKTLKRGDKVVFLSAEMHKEVPRWYPHAGTVGRVLAVGRGTARIQWPLGTTGGKGQWYAPLCEIAPAPTTLKTALNSLRGRFRKK